MVTILESSGEEESILASREFLAYCEREGIVNTGEKDGDFPVFHVQFQQDATHAEIIDRLLDLAGDMLMEFDVGPSGVDQRSTRPEFASPLGIFRCDHVIDVLQSEQEILDECRRRKT